MKPVDALIEAWCKDPFTYPVYDPPEPWKGEGRFLVLWVTRFARILCCPRTVSRDGTWTLPTHYLMTIDDSDILHRVDSVKRWKGVVVIRCCDGLSVEVPDERGRCCSGGATLMGPRAQEGRGAREVGMNPVLAFHEAWSTHTPPRTHAHPPEPWTSDGEVFSLRIADFAEVLCRPEPRSATSYFLTVDDADVIHRVESVTRGKGTVAIRCVDGLSLELEVPDERRGVRGDESPQGRHLLQGVRDGRPQPGAGEGLPRVVLP